MQKINITVLKEKLFSRFKKTGPVGVSSATKPEDIVIDITEKEKKSWLEVLMSVQSEGLTAENIPIAILAVTAVGVFLEVLFYLLHVSWVFPLLVIIPIVYMTKVRVGMNTPDEFRF